MGGCMGTKPQEKDENLIQEEVSVVSKVSKSFTLEENLNRQSLQVYCGDPRVSMTSQDKHPGDIDQSKHAEETPHVTHPVVGTDTILEIAESTNKPSTCGNSTPTTTHKITNNVIEAGKDKTVPEIIVDTSEEGETDKFPIKKMSWPPQIAPFDPSMQVKRRPRSLDSADHQGYMHKSRPLSYSPGLGKTVHPRFLHRINEKVLAARPQSIDVQALLESKGFDVQKFQRVHTQKSPRKREEHSLRKHRSLEEEPNQVRYLEEGPSRYFQPSQMLARKKSNKDLKYKEVVYLRKAVEKPRMKFSKSVELFLLHNEQYLSYDPLLDPQAVQPSNPWVSSDETLWDVNRDNVEIPTVLRIKKWALSFEDLLKDGTGRKEFEMFLKKEYSQENIHFYKACKELILCPNSKVEKWKTDIERGYLKAGATHEVNIDCKTMEVVRQRLKEPSSNLNASRYIFQPAMDHVYALMKKDSYTRFLRSDQYKALMEKAQNHPKKKFFSFGSNRKKTPSPQVQRRGSSSSDKGTEGELGGPGYHSFSTGNLRDLDDKPKRTLSAVSNRDSNVGSDSSIYVGTHEGQVNQSPSMRRKEEPDRNAANKEKEGRRRSNLDVPRTGFTAAGTPTEINRKSDSLSPCLALNVPRTNIVTPWEGGS